MTLREIHARPYVTESKRNKKRRREEAEIDRELDEVGRCRLTL